MPLLRLTGSYERQLLNAASDDVHQAMVSCLNVPSDDVFHVIDVAPQDSVQADSHYMGIERRRPLFSEMTLRAGRTDDAKRSFYQEPAQSVAKRHTIRPEDLLIVLRENAAVDWSFGNGVAQGAPATTGSNVND
jgi:4-oxalocrotonate tautomerase